MKFQFDSGLDYQREAIDAVTDLFDGQEICRTNFTVAPLKTDAQMEMSFGQASGDLGVGNRLRLLDEDVLDNLQGIQLRNGLAPSQELSSLDFTVEMETGTGKTYVYLRTLFELNQRYGFTKFIIVVPSVAIKEGVHKSLEMTEPHFQGLYDNTPFEYFVYDSQKLGQVRNFATSDSIQIMVINIDAFQRSFDDPQRADKANIIHRPHDRMMGNKPIEFIQETRPVVIIDEPQSVSNTENRRKAIGQLNPLCTLRYSATHLDKRHMLYRLDSVDAYEKKLVKQIEVSGIEVEDSHNKSYVKLLQVDNRKSPIQAQVELDKLQKGGKVKRQKKWVKAGEDLLDTTGGRSVYDGYIIEDIYCQPGNEYISFTSKPEIVRLGEAIGQVDDDEYKRLQIRKTIEEHLNKELQLTPQGIKVLSLFFIDKVANYREYDQDGQPQPGKYARMFEDEYIRAARKPKYQSLFGEVDVATAATDVQDGYFAVDKKKDASGQGRLKDSRGEGKTQADESAYNTIMKNKEWLLNFDCPLKFIFSHSALKEGWDNPNVFQICTLNETASTLKKRQEIGRGLRLAVNQDGQRVHGFDVNTLTVMANESYEDFAKQLQSEIEDEEGIKFGVVEKHLFASLPVVDANGEAGYLGTEASETVWQHLREQDYIDAKGKVQDRLRQDLKNGDVSLPEEVSEHTDAVTAVLRKVAGRLNIQNKDNRREVKLNKAVYLSDDFKQLWDRIKHKTTYRVDFDANELIEVCAGEIRDNLRVGKARFITRTARLDVTRGGVEAEAVNETAATYDARDFQLPDIVGYLQNATNLTRRTLVEILVRSERLEDFRNNPQKFIEQVLEIIRRQMRLFIVDGIKYQKIGDEHYYCQELFEQEELFGYLNRNMVESSKSVYDHVVYDSDVEADFAAAFERNDEIKVYAKLPPWFCIDTPLGSYNPDWAVMVEQDGQQRLYFVVESKGSLFSDSLRPTEEAKIKCGKAHFQALGNDVEFRWDNEYDNFLHALQ
ncbi:type III restriction-modification system endonuclease [Salinisphaera orenii]|uniref:type III restriction-modification system endonuclease n=1 Tax=Salinisphaera orenii TaxID=856731 RepID=UPI000DBE1532